MFPFKSLLTTNVESLFVFRIYYISLIKQAKVGDNLCISNLDNLFLWTIHMDFKYWNCFTFFTWKRFFFSCSYYLSRCCSCAVSCVFVFLVYFEDIFSQTYHAYDNKCAFRNIINNLGILFFSYWLCEYLRFF